MITYARVLAREYRARAAAPGADLRRPALARSAGLLLAAATSACAANAAAGKAKVTLRCSDPELELTVDGVPRGTAGDYSGAHRLLLSPGPHTLELRGHGMVEERQVSVGAGDDLTLNVMSGTNGVSQ